MLVFNALSATGCALILLKGFAWSAVEQVDDPAAGESVLLQDVVHDDVVFVGVYADVSGLGEGPFQKPVCCFMARFTHGDAVDDVVWRVVQPLAVVYPGICRVRARNEGHRGKDAGMGMDRSFAALRMTGEGLRMTGKGLRMAGERPLLELAQHEAYTSCDVLADNFLGGVAVIPLVHVSARAHDLPSTAENLHQLRNVVVCGLTYHLTFLPHISAS